MIVMGIDPGLLSGIAIFDTKTQTALLLEETAQGVHELSKRVRVLTDAYVPERIVWESFQLRAGNRFVADLSGVESIGWAKAEGFYQYHVAPATHKTFNMLGEKHPKAKSPVTKLMKEHGWPIGEGHTRDALSVAIQHSCVTLKDRATLETHQRLNKEK